MTAFREGRDISQESQIDEYLADSLVRVYDEQRKKGEDFLTARRKALLELRIPGEMWEKYLSALSKKVSLRRKRIKTETTKVGSGKNMEKGLNKLTPAILRDVEATITQRGGDIEEDDD